MKELLQIIRAYQDSPAPAALATVVRKTGSSYRRTGARMLVLSEQKTFGCISGGCLDRDVILHALKVIHNRTPAFLSYDTSTEHDVILGVGPGCSGTIEILVEFLSPHQPGKRSNSNVLDFLANLFQHGGTGAIATVIKTEGDIGLVMGDRAMVDNFSQPKSALTGGHISDELLKICSVRPRHGEIRAQFPEINAWIRSDLFRDIPSAKPSGHIWRRPGCGLTDNVRP